MYLDEATSSLDPISRLLAFAALKTWRRNKTTIVITHDLTQVEPGDFVYVLKGGKVVEQGFRYDLESEGGQGPGEFRRMVDAGLGGGQEGEREESEDKVDDDEDEDEKEAEPKPSVPATLKHQSLPAIRPLTFGNWMFSGSVNSTNTEAKRTSASVAKAEQGPLSSFSKKFGQRFSLRPVMPQEEEEYGKAKEAMIRSAAVVQQNRGRKGGRSQHRFSVRPTTGRHSGA